MAKISINMQKGMVEESDLIIGIDLGTTNSLVAYIEDEKCLMVTDQANQHTILPSIIYFDRDDNPVVGQEAKEKLLEEPERCIFSVKRLLGKSYGDVEELQQYLTYKIIESKDEEALVKIRIGDKFYNPVELSALILKELKVRTEEQLGKTIRKAVITVPAYFNDSQRQATRDAGKLAGLDVLRIVNEPTAASLAYGVGKYTDSKAQKIAVYDLGGGTFDISILHLEDGIFEVLSTNGNTYLGGDDVDRSIFNYWLEDKEKSIESLDPTQRQSLRLLAEKAKMVLSSKKTFTEQSFLGSLTLNQEKFHELLDVTIDETIEHCKNALKDASLKKEAIDKVIMVGGSTRSPRVKQRVSAFFGKEVFDEINPDEVVSMGAAVQANILAGKEKGFLLLDVTPLSLGIETVGGLLDVIIPRNSKIPIGAGRQYTTSIDGQKNLKIAIYQGERDLVQDNRKLGEFILSDIPPMPAGIPKIEIQFILDADGILIVKAKELRSGKEQRITINASYGISEEEMGLMLKDSIVHAKADMAIKVLKEAQNEGTHLINVTNKFLTQNEKWLSEAQKEKILKLRMELKKSIEEKDKDKINSAIDQLNEFCAPLAQIAMDNSISIALKGKKI